MADLFDSHAVVGKTTQTSLRQESGDGVVRFRGVANRIEHLRESMNEKILRTIAHTYTQKGVPNVPGLLELADNLKVSFSTPREQISVLMLGEEAATRRAVIGWYFGAQEFIDQVGQTMGASNSPLIVFSGATAGTSLRGAAAMNAFSELACLKEFGSDMENCVRAEFIPSRRTAFSLVNFIEASYGSSDVGAANSSFDSEKVLRVLSRQVDSIIVLIDPERQIRDLRLIEMLETWRDDGVVEKLLFCIVRKEAQTVVQGADAESEMESQIRQQLSHHLRDQVQLCSIAPPLSADASNINMRGLEATERLAKHVEQTLSLAVQKMLDRLELDASALLDQLRRLKARNRFVGQFNRNLSTWTAAVVLLAFFVPLATFWSQWSGHAESLMIISPEWRLVILVTSLGLAILALSVAASSYMPVLDVSCTQTLDRCEAFLTESVLLRKKHLYQVYFHQTLDAVLT